MVVKQKDFQILIFVYLYKNVARIQEMHILIGHIICSIVEKKILLKNECIFF